MCEDNKTKAAPYAATRESFSDRVFRIMAQAMPPHLAYALGCAKHYNSTPAITAMLRAEGLVHADYNWLTPIGDRLAAMLEPPPLPAATEPSSTPEPTPAPAELEQPAAPTFVPEPDVTPPGEPEPSPAALAIDARRLTIADAAGNPELVADIAF